jgi:hypothetical protein
MPSNGYGSDAAYFDLLARQSKNDESRRSFRAVAGVYRSLPGTPAARTFQQNWQSRAEKCRMLAGQFENPECRKQLLRLAETYDFLASCAGKT